MSKRITKWLVFAGAILFWLGIWQLFASLENNNFLFPDIPATFSALIEIIKSADFYKVIFSTLARVLAGLFAGITIGIVLAIASHHVPVIKALLSPIISVIKSTPVASFIIILWIKMNGNELAIFIAFLMVMPIIWQNLLDGYDAIDSALSEVCLVYEFSFIKKLKILVLPTLFKYLVPGIVTATGLAWKSEIAAEIIAYTKNSIGQNINDAKYFSDTPTVFAWSFIIICFSIALEAAAKSILKRCKKWE